MQTKLSFDRKKTTTRQVNKKFSFEESPLLKKRQKHVRKRQYLYSWPLWIGVLSVFMGLISYGVFINYDYLSSTCIEYKKSFFEKMGFRVKKVVIDGCLKTPKNVLNSAINVKLQEGIFQYDLDEIKEKLQQIEWIKDAVVYRMLPDKIYIHLIERQPIAIWQMKKKNYLLDDSGVAIYTTTLEGYEHLPIFSGEGAPEKVSEIIQYIHSHKLIKENIVSIVRVRNRRWDLVLKNNIIVKLPEFDPSSKTFEKSFKVLLYFLRNQEIKMDHIKTMDLRIPNKYYIETK